MLSPRPEPDDLPQASAEAVLIRVAISSYIAVSGRKRGERFLRLMAETLASEEAVSEIMPIRPRSDHEDVQKARRGALALFRAQLPVFLARLPPV
jgi:hypothetical protein